MTSSCILGSQLILTDHGEIYICSVHIKGLVRTAAPHWRVWCDGQRRLQAHADINKIWILIFFVFVTTYTCTIAKTITPWIIYHCPSHRIYLTQPKINWLIYCIRCVVISAPSFHGDLSQRAIHERNVFFGVNKQAVDETVELSVIWDEMALMWCCCNTHEVDSVGNFAYTRIIMVMSGKWCFLSAVWYSTHRGKLTAFPSSAC